MNVKPVSSMQRIICTTLTIPGYDKETVLEKNKHIHDNPTSGIQFPLNSIKVDALAEYYYKPTVLTSANKIDKAEITKESTFFNQPTKNQTQSDSSICLMM